MELDDITGTVVDASIGIHRKLGPGLLESVYALVLAAALKRRGLLVQRELPVSFSYDGMHFEQAFRVDLLIEECIIIEVKSLEKCSAVHAKQLLTYLRLMDLRVGLLLNFGAGMMKEGIKRIVNDLTPESSPHLRVNRERSSPRLRVNEKD
jgi:iron complex transport system substrate-binding protein